MADEEAAALLFCRSEENDEHERYVQEKAVAALDLQLRVLGTTLPCRRRNRLKRNRMDVSAQTNALVRPRLVRPQQLPLQSIEGIRPGKEMRRQLRHVVQFGERARRPLCREHRQRRPVADRRHFRRGPVEKSPQHALISSWHIDEVVRRAGHRLGMWLGLPPFRSTGTKRNKSWL